MKNTSRKLNLIKTVIVISLLIVLLLSVVSCEGLGFPTATNTPDTNTSEPSNTDGTTTVSYKDAAILAVYQHLLDRAGSADAKLYLADFYTACDNWNAESEYFKDGSGTWHVVVDMSDSAEWDFNPYWQQASWFVFRDGTVIPSNLYEGNALRIEADLQRQSPDLDAGSIFDQFRLMPE
jgi:hypothetical protein